MIRTIAAASVILAMPVLFGAQAEAKGCIKGAAVGAVAGHYMHHHAVMGAIGGCIVGHHMAAEKAKQEEYARTHPHPTPH
jgi:outer membrane lipoprotein SlyB